MKALRFSQIGTLDGLACAEVPEPTASFGELRVEVRAAGINPSDVKNVLGRFPYTTLPRTPGRDFAGVVVEGPDELVGAEVWGSGKELGFTRDGTHAEQLVVSAGAVASKPRALSFEQAACCGVPYTTAWDGLERARVEAGTTLLVIGAGACGRAVADLARSRGAEVVLAVRRAEHVDFLRRHETRAIRLQEGHAFTTAVRDEYPDGPRVVFDTTGFWLPAAVECLAPFGRVVVIAAPPDGQVSVPILKLYRRGGAIIGVNSVLHDGESCARMLGEIGTALDSGRLARPRAPRPWPLGAGLDAYRAIDRGSTEKMVLVP